MCTDLSLHLKGMSEVTVSRICILTVPNEISESKLSETLPLWANSAEDKFIVLFLPENRL